MGAIKIKAGLEQQEKNNTVAAAFHKWYKKVPQVAQTCTKKVVNNHSKVSPDIKWQKFLKASTG